MSLQIKLGLEFGLLKFSKWHKLNIGFRGKSAYLGLGLRCLPLDRSHLCHVKGRLDPSGL
jgi:hypothetical protein